MASFRDLAESAATGRGEEGTGRAKNMIKRVRRVPSRRVPGGVFFVNRKKQKTQLLFCRNAARASRRVSFARRNDAAPERGEGPRDADGALEERRKAGCGSEEKI